MDQPVTVRTYLDFEKPIAELESKVEDLKSLNSDDRSRHAIADEVTSCEQKAKPGARSTPTPS